MAKGYALAEGVKWYERVSTRGLEELIALVVKAYTQGRCTKNDCKLLVTRAVREYDSALYRETGERRLYYRSARLRPGAKRRKEHVVPVNCLVETLMERRGRISAAFVRGLLKAWLRVAYVTVKEAAALREYEYKMPRTNRETWARYNALGIAVEPLRGPL